MERHYGFNLDKIIDRKEEVFYEPTIERDADGMYEWKIKKVVEKGLEGKNMDTEKKTDMTNESNTQAVVGTTNNANPAVLQNRNFNTIFDYVKNLSYKIVQDIGDVTLTENQRRDLKKQFYQGGIRNSEFAVRKDIELNVHVNKKKIDFEYMKQTEIFKKKLANGDIKIPLVTDDGIVLSENDDQNVKKQRWSNNELIESFIDINELVKERDKTARDRYNIQMRNHTLNRHEIVSKDCLKEEFIDYISAMRPDDDIPPASHLENMFKSMINKIQYVEDLLRENKIVKISQYEIVCKDKIYDVLSGQTSPIDNGDLKLYNKHSFPIDFQSEDCEAEGFNKILQATFRDDETKKKTMEEAMGLIYSGIATVKKIILFQGVSNSGKSRIARIIANGFDEDYVVTIDKLNDLKGDENFNNTMLVIIDELPDKKLTPLQVSNLKKLSNGSKQVKILATTNHAVYTGEDGVIDKALLNRLLVIPFDNVMDSSDEVVSAYEDVYYEQERDIIVSNALKAFHNMLTRSENIANLQFSNNYPANDCVEVSVVPNEMNQINVDVQNINSVLEQKNQASIVTEDSLKQVLEGLYEITETINPEISTEIVMSDVNTVLKQEIFTDRQGFGKKMNNYYGDKLHSERKNGKMCYNLKYKNLVETK